MTGKQLNTDNIVRHDDNALFSINYYEYIIAS